MKEGSIGNIHHIKDRTRKGMSYVENRRVELEKLDEPCVIRILLNERFDIMTSRFIPLFNLAKCKYAFDKNKNLYLNEKNISTKGLVWEEQISDENCEDKINIYYKNIKNNEAEISGTFIKILNDAKVVHSVDENGNVYINFKKLFGWGNKKIIVKSDNFFCSRIDVGRSIAWEMKGKYGLPGRSFGEK